MKQTKKVIDLEFLRSVVGDDAEFERELFEIFLKSIEENTLKLKIALEKQDNNLWYAASHALKGSSAAVGAFYLSKALEKAQISSKENKELKREIFQEIEEELKPVIDFIKSIRR